MPGVDQEVAPRQAARLGRDRARLRRLSRNPRVRAHRVAAGAGARRGSSRFWFVVAVAATLPDAREHELHPSRRRGAGHADAADGHRRAALDVARSRRSLSRRRPSRSRGERGEGGRSATSLRHPVSSSRRWSARLRLVRSARKSERREEQERTGQDENVEHCNQFFTQNVAGVIPEAVEPARRHVLRRRFRGRELEGHPGVCALADEGDRACARGAVEGSCVTRSVARLRCACRAGRARPGGRRPRCAARGSSRAAVKLAIAFWRFATGTRSASRELPSVRAGRVVGAGDEAAEPPRRAHRALGRAGEVFDAEAHRDILALQARLRGERRCERPLSAVLASGRKGLWGKDGASTSSVTAA